MAISPSSATYIGGRKYYSRPQGILFADNPGSIGYNASGQLTYYPTGTEFTNFIVLTDDNRGPIDLSQQRIENRLRTINGGMRSYWTADKLSLNISWNIVPSRSFNADISFDENGKPDLTDIISYTSDYGAAGDFMVQWYEDNPGPFWVYLAYDKFTNWADDSADIYSRFNHLNSYNQVIQMYFSGFSYSIVKRGTNKQLTVGTVPDTKTSTDSYDWFNISMSLEEA